MNLDNNENNGLEQFKSFYSFVNSINNNNINFIKNTNLNIYEMFSILKPFISSLESYCCVINGNVKTLDDIYKLGYNNFKTFVKQKMPTKLYRYYSMKNEYGLQALMNNTVFLQTPKEFDDVFDSEISINFYDFSFLRLKEYCSLCGLETQNLSVEELKINLSKKLMKYYEDNGTLNGFFQEKNSLNLELNNKTFLLLVEVFYTNKLIKNEHDFAVFKALENEFNNYLERLKTTFRATCFTTNPYSQLMWSDYADCHNGFCIEYDIKPNAEKYNDIYENLFPVIYSKVRSTIPYKIIEDNYLEITDEYLWNICFCGALRKSIDWVWQDEWRLLLPYHDPKLYNIEFYPITKVFLGNRMSTDNKKRITDICNERKIEYIDIKKTTSYFDLK